MKAADLIRIMQFGDSALPVGAFTFSNGVESAIQTGVVHDAETLKGFVRTALKQAASGDGIAVVAAHRAVLAGDNDAILRVDRAVNNRKLNEEARLMATRMGKKLAEISVHIFDDPLVAWWLAQIKSGDTPGTQPVTQAIVMAVQGIGEREVVVMHQYGIAMTILSAAMRLMRITHFETQHILFELNNDIETFCDIAACGDIEQMSSYVPVIDVLAAVHTKSFVRLFMNSQAADLFSGSILMKKMTRIGIGGPVGSGKTAIIEVITPILIERGIKPLIITNDIVTTEDAKQVKRTLKGILDEEKILGVETGACPHTAVREDPSMNIAAVEDMEERFPDSDVIMIESGGDNLTLTFSPALADFYIYVIDVAEGEKIPRKNGPGLVQADILVINKIDLAPYVGASLEVMESDTKVVRGNRPYVMTNCKTGEGVVELVDMIMDKFLFTHQAGAKA